MDKLTDAEAHGLAGGAVSSWMRGSPAAFGARAMRQ